MAALAPAELVTRSTCVMFIRFLPASVTPKWKFSVRRPRQPDSGQSTERISMLGPERGLRRCCRLREISRHSGVFRQFPPPTKISSSCARHCWLHFEFASSDGGCHFDSDITVDVMDDIRSD